MFRARMQASLGVAALLGVCGSMQATAHHSVSMTYDMESLVTISGAITKVELINPHVKIELTTRTESGEEATWLVEMAAPNALVRQRGIDPREVFVLGRQVTIEAWPAKDGTRAASGHTLITPDGARLDVTDTFGRFLVPEPALPLRNN